MQTHKLRSPLTATFSGKSVLQRYLGMTTTALVNDQSVKPWQEIPGPPSLPLIGQTHHFLPGGIFYNLSTHDLTNKVRDIYGPIIRLDRLLGKRPMIIVNDAESIAHILRGEDKLPFRPGFDSLEYYRTVYKNKQKTIRQTTGLLTDQGDRWKQFRSTINPVVMQPKTIKLYSSALDEVAQDMIKRIKIIREDENYMKAKFDIEMNLWALESIAVVSLGGRLNCFDPNLAEDSPVRRLIKVVHDFFEIAQNLDFKHSLWKYFATPTFKRGMRVYEEQERLTEYFINRAKADLKRSQRTDEEKGVLEKLLEIDEKVAHIMASDMLFGGVDTTANTMIFNLYLLALNPEKQEKLREEVMTQKDNRPYLKACIKESLRLMPVISGNLRISTKEYDLHGYRIPTGLQIAFVHQNLSRSEENYKNAKEFIPERWIVPKTDPMYHGNAHPFAYIPFGFGTRMCIGRRIAELEIQTFLAKFIENFKVQWSGPPLKVTHKSLNYPQAPFNFVLKDV